MATQPSFVKFLPVTIMVGILAAISVLLWQYFAYPKELTGEAIYPWLQLWPVFIAWGLYFVAGAKIGRLHKEIIGIAGGILAGYLTLLIAFSGMFTSLFGATWQLPATVFLAAFIIVLLELTDWFELAPVYFIAYAGYFAYVFGGFTPETVAPESVNLYAMLYFFVPMMAGLLFAIVTSYLRKRILEAQGLYGSDQQTVYDKETV